MSVYSGLSVIVLFILLVPFIGYGLPVLVETAKFANAVMNEATKMAKNPQLYRQNSTEAMSNITEQGTDTLCKLYKDYLELAEHLPGYEINPESEIMKYYETQCNETTRIVNQTPK